jgi:NAD(P)-dependent dehydrogenase (short-subunit alcohol dehydrogenase family)
VLRQHLTAETFDHLFVTASVANDPDETVTDISAEAFAHVMMANALGPLRVIEATLALVRPTGTIGVISSGLGSVSDNAQGGFAVCRASKAALNILMRSLAARHASDSRTMPLIATGWVRTDMGGPQADLSVGERVHGVVDTSDQRSGRRDCTMSTIAARPFAGNPSACPLQGGIHAGS